MNQDNPQGTLPLEIEYEFGMYLFTLGLSSAALAVYIYMASSVNNRGEFWESPSAVGEFVFRSQMQKSSPATLRNKVRKAMKELSNTPLVETRSRGGTNFFYLRRAEELLGS